MKRIIGLVISGREKYSILDIQMGERNKHGGYATKSGSITFGKMSVDLFPKNQFLPARGPTSQRFGAIKCILESCVVVSGGIGPKRIIQSSKRRSDYSYFIPVCRGT